MMNRSSVNRVSDREAFTLLELLVAMAVFAFIVVTMVGLVSQASNIWRSGEGQNQRRSTGRALLQYISRELQQAVLPVDLPTRSSTLDPANLQFIASVAANPANSTVIPNYALSPHAIFWQAPIAKNTSAGDLACVGYFIKWDTTNGRAKAQLCRYFVDPSATNDYLIYQMDGTAAANWLANIPTVAPASSANLQGWFANDVVALWMRCLDSYGQPITQTAAGTTLNGGFGFDSRQGFIDSSGAVHVAPALPAAVEIALVTLDQATAAKLTGAVTATPTSPANFHQDISNFMNNVLPANVRAGAQIFFTTVYLQNYRP